jgi:Phage-related minor tail protein
MAITVEQLVVKVEAETARAQKGLSDVEKSVAGLKKANEDLAKSNTKLQQQLDNIGRDTSKLASGMRSATTAVRSLMGAFAVGAIGKFALDAVEAVASLGRLSQQTGISVEQLSALKFAAESVGIPFQQLEQSIAGFSQRLAEGLGNATSAVSLALRELGISARDAQGNVRGFADILPLVADRFAQTADGVGKTQIAVALFGEEAGRRMIPLLNQGSEGIKQLTERARELGVVFGQDAVKKAQDFQIATVALNASLQALVTEFTLLAAPTITSALLSLTNMIRELNKLRATATDNKQSMAELEVELQRLQERKEELQRSWVMNNLFTSSQKAELDEIEKKIERITTKLNAVAMDPTRASGSEVFRAAFDDLAKHREAMAQFQFEFDTFVAQATGQRTLLQDLDFAWMSHTEIIIEAQRKIRQAYGETAEAHRNLAKVEQQINLQFQQQAVQVARTAASTITALFPKQKGAAIAAAIINTAVGITEAMKLMFPLNFIQAGLIAATGAAQIAAIRNTSPTGGGSVPSPGGGGGGTPATPPTPEGPSGRSITIAIQGGQLFSSEQLAELIDRINDEVANGATLLSTEVR